MRARVAGTQENKLIVGRTGTHQRCTCPKLKLGTEPGCRVPETLLPDTWVSEFELELGPEPELRTKSGLRTELGLRIEPGLRTELGLGTELRFRNEPRVRTDLGPEPGCEAGFEVGPEPGSEEPEDQWRERTRKGECMPKKGRRYYSRHDPGKARS